MENMFPYFYPRNQHRVFDPVNVTKSWSGQINNLAIFYGIGLAAQLNVIFRNFEESKTPQYVYINAVMIVMKGVGSFCYSFLVWT